MKKCPECQQWFADSVLICKCGYRFPTHGIIPGGENSRSAAGIADWIVVLSSLAGLVISLCFIVSGLTGTVVWMSSRCSPTMPAPQGRLFSLVVGLLVGGGALFALMTTGDYRSDLTWEGKILVILSMAANTALTIFIVFVWMLSGLCE